MDRWQLICSKRKEKKLWLNELLRLLKRGKRFISRIVKIPVPVDFSFRIFSILFHSQNLVKKIEFNGDLFFKEHPLYASDFFPRLFHKPSDLFDTANLVPCPISFFKLTWSSSHDDRSLQEKNSFLKIKHKSVSIFTWFT